MRLVGKLLAAAVFALGTSCAHAAISVHVDQSAQRMTVRANGSVVGVWAVSTARIGARTPNGTYRPYMLSRHHRSSLYNWAPMPYSVFFRGNYAIHGTNQIRDLGRPASAGCIRLHPGNARVLFELVQRYGMRNVSITITGATGGALIARRGQQRRVASSQQRRSAQRATRTLGPAAATQRQVRPTTAVGVSGTPTSVSGGTPRPEL